MKAALVLLFIVGVAGFVFALFATHVNPAVIGHVGFLSVWVIVMAFWGLSVKMEAKL